MKVLSKFLPCTVACFWWNYTILINVVPFVPTRMIDYLNKENFKWRSKAYLLKTDLNEIKSSHAHLSEQYAAIRDSNEAVRQHAAVMSKANAKLNLKNIELKKKYSDAKETSKKAGRDHKAELQLLKDAMNAKDRDNAMVVSLLQSEVATLTTLKAINERSTRQPTRGAIGKESTVTSAATRNQQKRTKGRRSTPTLKVETNTRAKITGRKSPMFSLPDSMPSTDDDERWGHDGFFESRNDEPSPSNNSESSNKKPPHRKSRKQRTPTAVPNSNVGRRVPVVSISPEQNNGAKIRREPSSSSLRREGSTSSVKHALDKSNNKGTRSRPNSRRPSSLATAAAKPSSVAERAGKK